MLRQPDSDEGGDLVLTTDGVSLRVTNGRLMISVDGLVRLDVSYAELRRIQFDLEAERRATLVIVPHLPRHEPQLLTVARDDLEEAAAILAFVGQRMP
jgi:hypothetical protein